MKPAFVVAFWLLTALLIAPGAAHASRSCRDTSDIIGFQHCTSIRDSDISETLRYFVAVFAEATTLEPHARLEGGAATQDYSAHYSIMPALNSAPVVFGGAGLRLGGYLWRGLHVVVEGHIGYAHYPDSPVIANDVLTVHTADMGYLGADALIGYTLSLGPVALFAQAGFGFRHVWMNTTVQYGEEPGASDVHSIHPILTARAGAEIFATPRISFTVTGGAAFYLEPAFTGTVGITFHGRANDH